MLKNNFKRSFSNPFTNSDFSNYSPQIFLTDKPANEQINFNEKLSNTKAVKRVLHFVGRLNLNLFFYNWTTVAVAV